MRHTTGLLALALLLVPLAEARAQAVLIPSSRGGYAYGGGIGFSYRGRHLSISGFLGGFGSARYGMVGPSYLVDPYPLPPPGFYPGYPPYGVERRIIIQQYPPPPPVLLPVPPLRDECAGEDLDEKWRKRREAAKQPSLPKEELPALPPGKEVSQPAPPLVRPGEVKPQPPKEDPPPRKEQPPPKAAPPEIPPPQANADDESARLAKLGNAAFAGQEYGLAAHRYRQATLVQPKAAPPHFLLAQAHFALGKYREAVEAIHTGMTLTKNWPKAPFHPRADLYKGNEPDFATHLKRLQDTLAQSPEQPAYLFLYAYQLWFDNRRVEAVVYFQRARKVSPDASDIDPFIAAAAPGVVAAN